MTRTRIIARIFKLELPASHLRRLLYALALCSVFTATNCFAGTGIFGTYLFLDQDGTSVTYGLSETGGATTDDFHNASLGTYTALVPLTLNGAQANTFKNGGGDVTAADLFYRVYESGGSAPGFTQVNLPFGANATYTDAGGVSITGSGDQKWEKTNSGIDLLDGLALGTYDLEVYVRASTNEGDRYHNNGGGNYIASFVVASVPEVSSAITFTLVFGSFCRRRRLRTTRT